MLLRISPSLLNTNLSLDNYEVPIPSLSSRYAEKSGYVQKKSDLTVVKGFTRRYFKISILNF